MLNGKNILIENCAGIGDLIMFTPTFRQIKTLYPNCTLTVVTKCSNMPVVQNLPYVDYVYGIERKKTFGRLSVLIHLFKQDYVIFTTWQPQLAYMAYLYRVAHRISIYKEKYKDSSLFHKFIKSWVLDKPGFAADIIAEQIGYSLDINLDIDQQCDVSAPKSKEIASVKNILSHRLKGKYVVISPFSSRLEKDIPINLLSQILNYVVDQCKLECVVIGTVDRKNDVPVRSGVYNLLGETTLMEMVELIKGAEYVIAADSGPVHIACEVQRKIVAIFSRYLPEKWSPSKYALPVSLYMDCAPCTDEEADACSTHACITGIGIDHIIDAIKKI